MTDSIREQIQDALNAMPVFYEHEFGDWKMTLAKRIGAAPRVAFDEGHRRGGWQGKDYPRARDIAIRAGIEALRSAK